MEPNCTYLLFNPWQHYTKPELKKGEDRNGYRVPLLNCVPYYSQFCLSIHAKKTLVVVLSQKTACQPHEAKILLTCNTACAKLFLPIINHLAPFFMALFKNAERSKVSRVSTAEAFLAMANLMCAHLARMSDTEEQENC